MKNPFKIKKTGSKSNITIINVAKELLTLKISIQNWIKVNVQNIAKYMSAMVDSNVNINHIPAVVHIRQIYQSKVNEIGAIFDKNLSHFQTVYNKRRKEFGGNALNAESDKQKDLDALETERNKVLDGASDGHNNDMDDTEKTIEKLGKDVKDKEDKLNSLPKHNLRPIKIGSGVVITLLVLAEIYMNRDAYEYAGFYDPASTIIGIGIAMGTFALGVGLAKIWRNLKHTLVTKISASVVLVGIVGSLYYVLGVVRLSQMSSEESEGVFNLSPVYFMTMNLVLFSGIFLSKLLLHPSPQKIADNETYYGAKSDLKECQKKLSSHKKRFFNGYQEENKKRDQVKKEYDKKMNPIKTVIDTEIEVFRKSALDFNTELALARNFFAQIDADYKSSVALLFNTVPQYMDGKALLLDMDALESLEDPFLDILLLATNITAPVVDSKNVLEQEVEQTPWEIKSESQSEKANYSFINSKEN